MAEAEPTQVDEFVREAAALAARAWDDLGEFLKAFDEILYRAVSSGHQSAGVGVLRALASKHGKNLISRMAEIGRWALESDQGKRQFWPFYHDFCHLLPELSFDSETLAEELEPVLLAEAADMASGGIYKAVEDLARRSRETADLLFETFVAHPASPVAALAGSALLGLAHFDLREAHRRALALTREEARILRRVGVGTLGSLHYLEIAEDLLQATLERLEEFKAKPDPEIDDVLARAYGFLIGRAEEASRAFVEIAGRPESAVQAQVAFILLRKADSDHRADWYREALLYLARVPTAHTNSLRSADHCASRYAHDKSETAIEFLEAFVKSRQYGREGKDQKIPELLGQTCSILRREALEVLEAAITRWFASSDRRLHQAASDLVMHGHYGSRDSKLAPLKLSKRILDSLDEQMLSLVLYRILGYVICGRPLAALIASALQREPLTPPLGGLVEEALAEHVLYNYPGGGGEYLTAYLESDEIAEAIREVLQRALARSESYLSALKSLPRLNELRPSTHRMARMRLAEQKFHGAIMEEARNRSVLMSLMHHTTLKFGASSFTEMEGVFTEPTALGTISHSVELPRGELIDPVGQHLLRLQWRTIGLQEEPEEV